MADDPAPVERSLPTGVVWLLWAATLVLLACLLWFVPEYQVSQAVENGFATDLQRPSLENEYRRTLAQVLGGLALALGIYLTYRRTHASERAAATAQDTLRVSREGQITERFTRAVDQLGSDQLAIRLGGIYALERIARDSRRDHATCMEVLCAFVRTSARLESHGVPKWFEDAEPTPKPIEDVQAALTVIGRRNTDFDRQSVDEGYVEVLNLSKCDLSGYELSFLNFKGANFRGAWLYATNMADATVAESYMRDCVLDRANLRFVSFRDVMLENTSMVEAEITYCDLHNAARHSDFIVTRAIMNEHTSVSPEQLEMLKGTPVVDEEEAGMSVVEGRLPTKFTPIEEIVSVEENERLKKLREREEARA